MRLTALSLLLVLVACQPAETKTPTEQPVPAASSAPNPQRGVMLAGQYGCNVCHTVPGVAGPQGSLGPSLAQLGAQTTIAAGSVPVSADAIARYIQDPAAIYPQSSMPPVMMPDADARDIAAYLLTLK